MDRIKRLLPAIVGAVLLLSLFFVNGSVAEPLGSGLLNRFGVTSSGQGDTGGEAAPFIFSLPVTVKNQDDEPVPVTVQGDSGDPLTATIDGTVDTNATVQGEVLVRDVNDPTVHPYQHAYAHTFTGDDVLEEFLSPVDVPEGQRLVIRYVSAEARLNAGEASTVRIFSNASGYGASHIIPMVSSQVVGPSVINQHGTETWITVDPGTTYYIDIAVSRAGASSGGSLDAFISGYLVDVPSTP